MADIVYRPRSASEILDASIILLRHNFKSFVVLTAVAYLPLAVLGVLFRRYTGLTPETAQISMSWNVVLIFAVQLIGFQVMTALVAILASRAYAQEPLDPGSTWRLALPRLPAIIGTAILVAIGSAIGFILLFFPGFYFYTRFGLAPLIAVLEGTNIRESFGRSTYLSHGQKLHILGVSLLALIIYFIVAVGLGIAFTMLPSILLKTVFGYFGTILVWPMLPMIQTALYYDLRIRAEGYDVDLMSRQLDTIPNAAAEAAF